jgi:hypothetical protein
MNQDQEEPGGNGKHPEAIIYIANLSEDVWPFINAISDPDERQKEIEENATTLSDRDLFALADEDHILFIAPSGVSSDFLDYYKDLFGIKDIKVLVTKQHSGEICRDILLDDNIIAEIIKAANSSKKVTMVSYATSFQFLNLVSELRNRGLTINTPEAPDEENAWTVNFYGSKSGVRQLAQQSGAKEPDLVMPDGLVCVSIVDAARIAANWYVRKNGVVIKTNKGHSGAGVLIFRPGDLPNTYHACEQEILERLKKDAYWDRFPIVVEDYIPITPNIGGGFPNVEFKVMRNGHIDFLYYCSLRVTKEGVFKGTEINHDVIPTKQATQIVDTGFFIAERYAQAGYRGYFDVDYIAGKNGKIYVTESNVRRTGGTHVYQTAEKLFGKDFMYETYILSHNSYPIKNTKIKSFNSLKNYLKPILFNKKSREGIIIASASGLKVRQLAYIIFGKNEKRALEIEIKMEKLLS